MHPKEEILIGVLLVVSVTLVVTILAPLQGAAASLVWPVQRRCGRSMARNLFPLPVEWQQYGRMSNRPNSLVELAVEEVRSWARDAAEADAAERFVRGLGAPEPAEEPDDRASVGISQRRP